MNLWDKTSRSALLIVVCSLFFVTCEEELNNVGKDINGDQFELLFKEFMLSSHVIIDSLSTAGGDLLTGTYNDPSFGVVSAKAYTKFVGLVDTDLSVDNIEFDSVMLTLKLAPYYYGAKTETPVIFKIHRLTEEISDLENSTNFSEITYDPTPLGEASFTLIPEKYDTLKRDETDSLTFKLDHAYFLEIKNDLILDTTALNLPLDFFGFAIVASGVDKVVGINMGSVRTNLAIHYHTFSGVTVEDTLIYKYTLSQQGFNKITSDRSGTPIAGITDDKPSMPFEPSNNMRYMQSGTGITTEVDFAPFINFFSDKEHVIINSAQISLGEIESTIQHIGPGKLSLLNTDENSEFSSLEILEGNFPAVQSDFGKQLMIPYQSDDNNSGVYRALASKYFQRLYDTKIERSTAVIQPFEISGSTIFTEVGYTVDRFIVHKDSIKLKVYYTSPK